MKEEASRRPICPWLAAVVVSLGVVQKKVSNIDHSQNRIRWRIWLEPEKTPFWVLDLVPEWALWAPFCPLSLGVRRIY